MPAPRRPLAEMTDTELDAVVAGATERGEWTVAADAAGVLDARRAYWEDVAYPEPPEAEAG